MWNATVANLTLMALGSSAPEILLSVIETVKNLGGCAGELGASTIVGSAAFNLLVISAVSLYAVNESNDTDPERDDTVPKGVKKINDMGVFSITAFFSVLAYIWMFVVLRDQSVSVTEAWITFALFFVLIGLAFGADRYKTIQDAKLHENDEKTEQKPSLEYSALEVFRELISEKEGKAPKSKEEIEKRQKMKGFIKETMKTDQIEKVNLEDLKKAIDGDDLVSRIKYRKQVGNIMSGKRKVIEKGEIMKQEHAHAEHLDETEKNEVFGFSCLHYSVSEASGSLRIVVLNKKGAPGRVRVLTIDAEALAGDDYEQVDEILEFKQGEK